MTVATILRHEKYHLNVIIVKFIEIASGALCVFVCVCACVFSVCHL